MEDDWSAFYNRISKMIDEAGASGTEMKGTVKEELRSYSAVVEDTCSAEEDRNW